MKKRFALALVLAVLLAAVPAFAITAGDFLRKMNRDEQHGYLAGAIEMSMYLSAVREKNNARSECIRKWFYDDPDSAQTILATFEARPDLPAAALLNVLIDRNCGRAGTE